MGIFNIIITCTVELDSVLDVSQLTRFFLFSIGGCHPILGAYCAPRPTFVRLPDPPFGKSYFPRGVLINQCSGFCYYERLTCLGVAFRNVSKDIYEISWSDRNYGMSSSIAGNFTATLLFNVKTFMHQSSSKMYKTAFNDKL